MTVGTDYNGGDALNIYLDRLNKLKNKTYAGIRKSGEIYDQELYLKDHKINGPKPSEAWKRSADCL